MELFSKRLRSSSNDSSDRDEDDEYDDQEIEVDFSSGNREIIIVLTKVRFCGTAETIGFHASALDDLNQVYLMQLLKFSKSCMSIKLYFANGCTIFMIMERSDLTIVICIKIVFP